MSEKSNGTGSTAVPSQALTRAVKLLLRPVVGFLLDNGLTYTWLTRLLKIIFVDVAEKEFGPDDKPVTDSRLSLITGVHRRDVSRLRKENPEEYEPPSSIFLGPRLIAIWISDERFLDKNGYPASLPRKRSGAVSDGVSSFEDLVVMLRTDIRPRSVLDELLRLGVVRVDESDNVILDQDSFIPTKGEEEKFYFLGKNIHDHIAASRKNLSSATPPFLERSVYYDELTSRSVKSLAMLSRRKSITVLQELNAEARRLQIEDKASDDNNNRMHFGYYFYSDTD